MDHKSWPWKKKSTEKTLIAADETNLSINKNEEEMQALQNDKAELERDLERLNDKLSSAISECKAKDEYAKKQAKIAQEAIAGWEKAETDAIFLKQELDKAFQQRAVSEERLVHLDAALKECMQHLRFVREEQEQRIHDAVMKTSNEYEKMRTVLEENIAEASKRLAKLGTENTQLSKALLAKEKVIEDLNGHKVHTDGELHALITRLESVEKENASLKYEVRVLEKEHDIRNEEREFNRRTADVTHKQHLESAKKIAKLEAECQRLRILVRKRLPGPAALAKMKNEAEMLYRDQSDTRRRKSNPSSIGSVDFSVEMTPDTPRSKISFLTDQLCLMEEENRTLKEALHKKTNELQFSKNMHSRIASKLSQVEGHLEESSDGGAVAEAGKSIHSAQEVSLASMSDLGSDDKASCAESWASALISELEHFKSGRKPGVPSCGTVATSDMNLMDDFVEMEKLAVVSVHDPSGNSLRASEEDNAFGRGVRSQVDAKGAAGKGTIQAYHSQSDLSISNQDLQSENMSDNKGPGWLDYILKEIVEKSHVTERNPEDTLEDIRIALGHLKHSNLGFGDLRGSSDNGVLYPSATAGHTSQRSPDKYLEMDSPERGIANNFPEPKNRKLQSDMSTSIQKMIELIEGITKTSLHDCTSESSTGYMVRVFQWKTSELSEILQLFIEACDDLLNGKAGLGTFSQQLTCTLEWIMNHCFSLQDVSSMKDAIKNHFDWDETRSETEVEGGMYNNFSAPDRMHVQKEDFSYAVAASSGYNNFSHIEDHDVKEDVSRLKSQLKIMESTKEDLIGELQVESTKNETLKNQLQKAERTIESLQTEVETLEQLKVTSKDQMENHKTVKEDLETQLEVAKLKLSETQDKLSYLEKALENRDNSCDKQTMSNCLQQPPGRNSKKEVPDDIECSKKQLQNDEEIAAASEKLAECQETILNLGKQLKALASPRDAALFEKVILMPGNSETATSTTPKRNTSQRSSLLEKMMAEDNAKIGNFKSPEAREICMDSCSQSASNARVIEPTGEFVSKSNHQRNEPLTGSFAIVPRKKKGGGGFLKKLLWRRKKPTGNRTLLS